MKTMKLFTMLFLAMGIMFTSCDKEGSQGEIGPQGEVGPAGPAGEQGAQGEPGEDGNANVIASDWMDTDFDDEATTYTVFDIEIPNLTRAEINESVVLVYLTNGTIVYPVPLVNSFYTFNYYLRNNDDGGYDIYLFAQSLNGNSYAFDWMDEFRYVIVPSGTAKSASVNLNKMTYEEVMDHFGLDY